MALSAENLRCERDDRALFTGLGFTLNDSAALLVEGRNGSGKTTLLRLLCGVREPDQGEIRWHGANIRELGAEYRRQFVYVGHMDGVKRELTAVENLRFARAWAKSDGPLPEQALERVRLRGYEDVMVARMSAGQRRRVALARLLVSDAPLWILDEPFTSLDRWGIKLVEELMAEHLDAGGMVVTTSHHDMDLGALPLERLMLTEPT